MVNDSVHRKIGLSKKYTQTQTQTLNDPLPNQNSKNTQSDTVDKILEQQYPTMGAMRELNNLLKSKKTYKHAMESENTKKD